MGLEMVEIIMECEDEFGIEIPDQLASNIRTVADLRDLIAQLAGSGAGTSLSRVVTPDAVFARLRTILSDQLGVREQDIQPECRFVEDLNCG